MKQIIIFLLVIITFILAYGQYKQYKQYKRFSLTEYQYTANKNIDLNYHDRSFLLDYYQAIESLNGYVIMQWSTESIDVRNPDDDEEKIIAATAIYNDILGRVKFYEDQLVKSANLKQKGMTNVDIKFLETNDMSLEAYTAQANQKDMKDLLRAMFDSERSKNGLRLGSSEAFISEIQKLLTNKGYDITIDDVFKNATLNALRLFEEKNGLFPDGKLDALTSEALLR